MCTLFPGPVLDLWFENLMSSYLAGFWGHFTQAYKMGFLQMKCFIARIKSLLQVEYS